MEAAHVPVRRSAVRGHRVVGAVAPPARLADGLSDDEVFTSSTGALWGGGRARWGDEILTGTADRLRGEWWRSGDGEFLR
jgi:hypothetical protein